jgi:hypothetical protein
VEFDELSHEYIARCTERKTLRRKRRLSPEERERLKELNQCTARYPPENCSENELFPGFGQLARRGGRHQETRSIHVLSAEIKHTKLKVKRFCDNYRYAGTWLEDLGWKAVEDYGERWDGLDLASVPESGEWEATVNVNIE